MDARLNQDPRNVTEGARLCDPITWEVVRNYAHAEGINSAIARGHERIDSGMRHNLRSEFIGEFDDVGGPIDAPDLLPYTDIKGPFYPQWRLRGKNA